MKKTNDPELPIRQLIKFSNYSLCITLPKDFVDNLGWQQGDRIAFQLTQENNLVLTRQGLPVIIPKREILAPSESNLEAQDLTLDDIITENKDNINIPGLDNLEPIPQIN